MPSNTNSNIGHCTCDECGSSFEVIPADNVYQDVSFCCFCGSEVVLDNETFDDDDTD